MTIRQKIQAYYREAATEHHRYRSWEHCYLYFRRAREEDLVANRDHAALQLAFYLASWGMYRGSGFLLQHTFTVHRDVIDLIAEPRFTKLWKADFGGKETDDQFVPVLDELVKGVRQQYQPFEPTDTLITKIILGTFGCLPACDRYFIDGFKSKGFKYSCVNDKFFRSVRVYCQTKLVDLLKEQKTIEQASGIRYPLMKLVDMYFWQIGYEQGLQKKRSS